MRVGWAGVLAVFLTMVTGCGNGGGGSQPSSSSMPSTLPIPSLVDGNWTWRPTDSAGNVLLMGAFLHEDPAGSITVTSNVWGTGQPGFNTVTTPPGYTCEPLNESLTIEMQNGLVSSASRFDGSLAFSDFSVSSQSRVSLGTMTLSATLSNDGLSFTGHLF